MSEMFSADALQQLANSMAQHPAMMTDTATRTADPHGIGIVPYLALAGGSGADLATTLDALAHVPGAHEANPILRRGGTPGMVATKVGGTAVIMALMHYLATHGHPTLAKSLGYGTGAGFGALALHNATVGR